jgi:two-component system cell cycle response regulator
MQFQYKDRIHRTVPGIAPRRFGDIEIKNALEALHDELKSANRKILTQQKSVIEEERLRLLFKRIGILGHDMGQPLMGLLGTLSLIRLKIGDPIKLQEYLERIEQFGNQISDILQEIQITRHKEDNPSLDEISLSDTDQEINILTVEGSNANFENVRTLLEAYHHVGLIRTKGVEEALQVLERDRFDLILLDHRLADGNGLNFFKRIENAGIELPVIILTIREDELEASRLIQAGACDYLSAARINRQSLEKAITSGLQKFRLIKETRLAREKLE